MKIIRIQGGLGNQMFQYAFAYKLKKLYPFEEVLIDTKDYKGYRLHPYELQYVFDIDIPEASFFQLCKLTTPFSVNTSLGYYLNRFIKRKNVLKEKELFAFNQNVFKIKGDCYYDGYWFNENYFSDIRADILKVFSFKRPLRELSQQFQSQIESTNSVSIHVRRGNFLQHKAYMGICEKAYYKKAIELIKTKVHSPHFFVFSNDMEWCKHNLADLMDNYTLAFNNEPRNNYVDMQLMSLCRHNIIAHSSFSWWAAWLNKNPNAIVVAPFRWVNNDMIQSKPQLKKWHLIEGNE